MHSPALNDTAAEAVSDESSPESAALVSIAEQCVMCGLCLPHCPTYLKTGNENESPRGRIALSKALLSARLEPTATLARHLDSCLLCRACEDMCPSAVDYSNLMDGVRASLNEVTGLARPGLGRLADLATHRTRGHAMARALRLYQRTGLRNLVGRTGLLKGSRLGALEALLPEIDAPARWQPEYPACGASRGDVALFTGCVSEIMGRRVLEAAIQVLTAFGFTVHIPDGQVCCGALHLHDGQPGPARDMARQNLRSFADKAYDAVVTIASGCGATLSEYGRRSEDGAADSFSGRVTDISAFLTRAELPAGVSLAPLPCRVAVHDPCTLVHVLHEAESVYSLLARIPELEIGALPGNERCCGGAGKNMITQPDMAAALRADKLAHLERLEPDVLVTSNIGCALHLGAGIRAKRPGLEILHPVELIARQLRGAR